MLISRAILYPPRDVSILWIEPAFPWSPALKADFLPLSYPGSPLSVIKAFQLSEADLLQSVIAGNIFQYIRLKTHISLTNNHVIWPCLVVCTFEELLEGIHTRAYILQSIKKQ